MKHRYSIAALLAYPITSSLLVGCGVADPGSEDATSQSAELKAAANTSAHSGDSLEKADMAEWRKSIANTPLPHRGCFEANHPSLEWKEVACEKPSVAHAPVALPPRAPRQLPTANSKSQAATANSTGAETVGSGTAFVAATPGINQVVGSFPIVRGLLSENDDGVANKFSLQINSNEFTCSTCNGAGCTCWQQFVFQNPGYTPGDQSAGVFMQYWLIGYGNTCPDISWHSNPIRGGSCWKNSEVKPVASQPITNLVNLSLAGQVNVGGTDFVTIATGAGSVYAAGADSMLSLGGAWNEAEFNVFGYNGAAKNATFNSATRIDVQEIVRSGSAARATCKPNAGTTGETNNLTLTGNCCPSGGHPAVLSGGNPGIQFTETTGYLLDPADGPYCVSRSLDAGGSFPVLPGTAQDIGVGSETAWIVDSNSYVQKWLPSQNGWQSSGRSGAKHIAVQPDGVPWYIGTNDYIFQGSSNDPATITWTQRAGCAKDIGIGANGDVWVVGCTAVNGGYDLHKWNGSVFVTDTSGGGATRIAVDSAGTPWIVNDRYEIFQRTSTDPTTGGWHIYGGGAQAVDIGIGPAGYPWIIGTSPTAGGYSIFGWDDVNDTWKPVWGGATQISVGSNGRPWLVNDAGHVFRAATQ